MSAPGFICVGGPLDGQWRAQEPRQTSFEVAELPSWDRFSTYIPQLDEAPCNLVGKLHCYVLREHDVHGAAWVCQS